MRRLPYRIGVLVVESSSTQLARALETCPHRATFAARQAQSGGGRNGTANDIAVAWPPERAPVLVVAYFTGSTIPDEALSAVIADAGRIAVAGL